MEELSIPDPAPALRVGITYNLKKGLKSDVADIEAEYDNIETVLAIKGALESAGHKTELLEADADLPGRLRQTPVDIVFNIAEGSKGRGREAQVPALLNLLGIPFVGSDETTLCIALDKALAKRLLATYHVRTPMYRVISCINKSQTGGLRYPVIVKPNAEGSSKGISDVCIAKDKVELDALVTHNIQIYGQDMLVEEYIGGREFTVGVIGNGGDIRVFRPMEIVYLNKNEKYTVYSYNVKQNYKELIRYDCPSGIDAKTETEMIKTAKKIYEVLSCHDFARMDFRLSEDGKLHFIEINPLPGLAPGYSDFPMLAEFNGVSYNTLVCDILNSALKRHGMKTSDRGESAHAL